MPKKSAGRATGKPAARRPSTAKLGSGFLTPSTLQRRVTELAALGTKCLRNLAAKTRGEVDRAHRRAIPLDRTHEMLSRQELIDRCVPEIYLDGGAYMGRGLLRVFRGDTAGYADVAGVARSIVQSLRVEMQWNDWMVETYGDLPRRVDLRWNSVELNQRTLFLLTAISLRQDECVDAIFRRLVKSLCANQEDWDNTPLETFAVALHCRWRGAAFKLPAVKCPGRDVYQAVLDGWKQERKFAGAVAGLCDYHIAHWKKRGQDAFAFPPFEFYPVELHALARIREDAGLSMPWPEGHPLLATPFGPPPPRVAAAPDSTLERALERCRQIDPGLPEI